MWAQILPTGDECTTKTLIVFKSNRYLLCKIIYKYYGNKCVKTELVNLSESTIFCSNSKEAVWEELTFSWHRAG